MSTRERIDPATTDLLCRRFGADVIGRLGVFCARFGVVELSLFGSVLGPDFGPESDVDVLLAFGPGAEGLTFERTPDVLDELRAIFGREVDVVEDGRVRNRFRAEAIMRSRRVVYAA